MLPWVLTQFLLVDLIGDCCLEVHPPSYEYSSSVPGLARSTDWGYARENFRRDSRKRWRDARGFC